MCFRAIPARISFTFGTGLDGEGRFVVERFKQYCNRGRSSLRTNNLFLRDFTQHIGELSRYEIVVKIPNSTVFQSCLPDVDSYYSVLFKLEQINRMVVPLHSGDGWIHGDASQTPEIFLECIVDNDSEFDCDNFCAFSVNGDRQRFLGQTSESNFFAIIQIPKETVIS